MTYIVLARKYRPKTFEEIIGQDHISKTLKNAVINGRVSHALLLSGPKGTGKTSVARILAKAVNCSSIIKALNIPCNECTHCVYKNYKNNPDLFEIDGASNNSVEQIRDLRENIHYSPIANRYKVYIIDEVHMLSRSAFNALLKTLEEPPSHVIFILATTEYRKIPPTIISRCQHHRFKRINLKIIEKHLENICRLESLKVEPLVLHKISRISEGSLRDSLTLLDQLTINYTKSEDFSAVLNSIGIVDSILIYKFVESILEKDITAILEKIDFFYENGYDFYVVYMELEECFKNLLILKKTNFEASKLLNLGSQEIKIFQKIIKKADISVIEQSLYILFKDEVYMKKNENIKLTFEIVCLKLNNTYSVISIDKLIEKLDFFKKFNMKIDLNQSNIKDQFKREINSKKNMIAGNSRGIKNQNNKKIELSKIFAKVHSHISKVKPSLAAIISGSDLNIKNNKVIEIKITKSKYALDVLKKNFKLIQKFTQLYANDEVKIEILDNTNNLKNKKINKKNIDVEIMNESLVATAIEIFDGEIEGISEMPNLNKRK